MKRPAQAQAPSSFATRLLAYSLAAYLITNSGCVRRDWVNPKVEFHMRGNTAKADEALREVGLSLDACGYQQDRFMWDNEYREETEVLFLYHDPGSTHCPASFVVAYDRGGGPPRLKRFIYSRVEIESLTELGFPEHPPASKSWGKSKH